MKEAALEELEKIADTGPAADPSFASLALTERLESFQSSVRDAGRICVVNGPLRLTGHLRLDFDREPWADAGGGRIEGLVVDGDLVVDGNVVNENGDYGPFLLVTGDLKARHAVLGGSEVRVLGNASFSGLLLGIYNHGLLQVDGETDAALILNDDYAMSIRSSSPFFEDGETQFGHLLSDYLSSSIPVAQSQDDPDVEALYGDDEDGGDLDTAQEILRRVVAGEEVLKAELPRFDRESWAQAVASKPTTLANVPEVLLTEAFLLEVVTENGYVLGCVPAARRSAVLVDAALESVGAALEYVPESLKTVERVRRALSTDADDPEYVVPYIPARLLAEHPELTRRIVRGDPGLLSRLPEESVTEELILDTLRYFLDRDTPATYVMRAVPAAKITRALAEEVARRSPESLGFLPSDLLGPDLLRLAFEHHPELPRRAFIALPAELQDFWDELRLDAIGDSVVDVAELGLRFKAPPLWELESEQSSAGGRSWFWEHETAAFCVLVIRPKARSMDLEVFAEALESGGSDRLGFRWDVQVPLENRSERSPVDDWHGFSGFGFQLKLEIVADFVSTRNIRYLNRDFPGYQALVSIHYRVEKEREILPEVETFLSSLEMAGPASD